MKAHQKRKRKITAAVIVALIAALAGYWGLSAKLAYLETAYFTFQADDSISADTVKTELREEFQMPYEIIKALSVKIGNNQRDSNAKWELEIKDKDGKLIFNKKFGFYDAADGNYYLIDFGKKLKVNQGETYSLILRALNIEAGSAIEFYRGYEKNEIMGEAVLSINEKSVEGALCMALQGGEKSGFWFVVYLFLLGAVLTAAIRFLMIKEKGLDWKTDTVIMAMITGIIVFLICLPFASAEIGGTFTDENDNIRGGMIIANGGVLYKDYVVQHTPVAYYLCAIFALLGAESIEQMRILFYMVLGVIWAVIYARHSKLFGRKKMLLLPLAVMLCTMVLIGSSATMILSDVIQETAMIILLLEFIRYYRDGELDVKHCFIISFGIWSSFGSAFLSVYSLFFMALGFLILEINRWKKEKNISVKRICSRYVRLFIIIIAPAAAGIVYFKMNHALFRGFEQTYLFNREVYPKYQSMGENIVVPFVSGVSSMVSQYVKSVLAFFSGAEISGFIFLTAALITGYMLYLIKGIFTEKKKIAEYIWLTLFLCGGATRGVDSFHSMAFWGMLITWLVIVALQEIHFLDFNSVIKRIVSVIVICVLLNPWASAVTKNISTKQGAVSYTDTLILAQTEDGEEIFLNAWGNDSIYLLAKNRYPANRAVYCLPWYMDWYEDWNIRDLANKKPNIAVWNPDMSCWGRSNYAMRLNDYINEHYERADEKSFIWIRNK